MTPATNEGLLVGWSAADHRRRLFNLQAAERGIRSFAARHRITNYQPGQASYNLGEYPSRKPYDPDEYDDQELARLSAAGVEVIQVMEDWNDLLRLHGADRFSSPNPEGMRRFIEMAHSHGIRVLLYVSSGYMQIGDPDLKEEWTRESYFPEMHAAHWKLIRCSPASPGWRSFILDKTARVLDDYDLDGLYNDWGYYSLAKAQLPATPDEVFAWTETETHDAAKEDLLALIYAEVKKRGLLYKLHADFNDAPRSAERLYDYLWVGEGVGDLKRTREETKLHLPYVVPQFDFRYGRLRSEEIQYLNTIPYMQFPQLLAGRPFTGERGLIPGVDYRPLEDDVLRTQWAQQWEYYNEHPQGPHIYGPWDVSPPRPFIRETHEKWLGIYRQIATEGAYVYVEITDSDLFSSPIPANVVASAFVNRESYLVLANYGEQTVTVTTSGPYEAVEYAGTVAGSRNWELMPQTLTVLQKIEQRP
ncbi:hypothetical protein [Microbacterium sp. 2MCAF23]|uniref:hypothetical protein n=1 Tax=Microbacterium sp. 2MCAF23 TaxID=3232985 RepID=UPI003F94E64F